jgi:predicted dehydrogenase
MKIGIVGLGSMGAMHLGALSRLSGVQVAAVCSRDPRARSGDLRHIGGNLKKEGVVHDFSAVRQYENWRDLIADKDLDAVDLCLPTDMHAEASLAALAAGKHVLCEKPMALRAAECDAMVAAARAHRRVLLIGHVLRFWQEYRSLADFVEARGRDRVTGATFRRQCEVPDWSQWLTDQSRSGGALLDLMIHDVDQALAVFGVPSRVAAQSMGEVDTARMTLDYGNFIVNIEGGWFPPRLPFSMTFEAEAAGEKLRFDAVGLFLNDSAMAVPKADAYEAELAYFVDCCRENREPERCRPEDGARAVKLSLLLKQSRDENGRWLPCEL